MKLRQLFAGLSFVFSATAGAACVLEPLEPQLQAADTVYIGTVIQSSLVGSLEDLQITGRPAVEHLVVPQRVLKGEPSMASTVVSRAGYASPEAGRFLHFSELVRISPGDTLLVVGTSGERPYVALCTATRRWDAVTEKVVLSVFPPAP